MEWQMEDLIEWLNSIKINGGSIGGDDDVRQFPRHDAGGALVCRFKGKEAFRVAGDGTTPESRRQLIAALREMLLKLPPKDGANIVEHGIAVDFDAPDLAKLIETELAIKVVSKAEKEK